MSSKIGKASYLEEATNLAEIADESVTSLAARSASGLSLLNDLGDDDLASLTAEDRDDTAAAEDEVFAAWGEQRLF
jgi:hypothetical protein